MYFDGEDDEDESEMVVESTNHHQKELEGIVEEERIELLD